jgi:nucleoside-diphosphate-sugar epimerase|tara:strand:+ start:175 stop:981 length:807 start_codon:yes stop_codon:yes gene_type:complete
MKIAITGSTSMFGTYLSKFFKKKREKVLNINRKKKFLLENTKTFNFKNKNVDVLIHLAHSYKANGRKVNYEGTKKLFSNAKKNKIKKIIFISTISSHKNALSEYGKTKYKIEKHCLKNGITFIRPGFIFGHKKMDKKLILMSKIMSFLPIIPYFENKKLFLYSVHIEELSNLIYKIILKNNNSKTYNIFSKRKIFFRDWINLNKNSKIKIKLPFIFFFIFFVIISKFIYLKSVDSFLGLLKTRVDYSNPNERNIFTKKNIISYKMNFK